MGVSLYAAHPRAARRLLDRRGPVGRHRVAPARPTSRRVLRLDGSPPLYYMLLHVWMASSATARGDARAVARLRAADDPRRLWAGRAACPAGAPAGSPPASPRCTRSSRTTRRRRACTRWSTLLGLLAAACFAARVRPARPRFWLPFAAHARRRCVYTHNWGLFFLLARRASRSSLWRADRRPPRAAARRGHRPTARSSCCTLRGCRRCSSRPPTPAAPWSTRAGPGQAACPRSDRLFGGPRRAARSSSLAAGLGAALGRRSARRQRSRRDGRRRGAPGGRGAARHRPRRLLAAWLLVADLARLHDALLRGRRRPPLLDARRRRAVQRAGRLGIAAMIVLSSCGGTTGRPS